MALPTNSTAPDAPTPSSIVAGVKTLVAWFGEVPTWIRALSPSGASVYDTGWQAVALDSDVTATGGAWIRRIGKTAHFQASTLNFPALASGSAVTLVTTLPAAFRTAKTARGGAWMSGGRAGVIGTDSSGIVQIWNQTGTPVTSAQVWLSWTVD